MSLRLTAFTLFPRFFDPLLEEGVFSRGLKHGQLSFDTVNPRDFSLDSRRTVDGHPVGGGDGMVLLPDVCTRALDSVATSSTVVIHVSPGGKVFNNEWARHFAQSESHLVFLCGRYAGFDQRFVSARAHHELSVGDFVLSGGEAAAVCMMDSIARFVPGVLGNEQSAQSDSFEDGLLEAPQYAHPVEFAGQQIPPVLLSGHHAEIAKYRRAEQIRRTALQRPDLLLRIWNSLSRSEQKLAEALWRSGSRPSGR
ncbi:MAG: tRNA (guanosine(37)-N1)-methyltransferase TrmD [Betaproteobacteria bacterium]|nr:tRNA (guanosine(37)-N1)-methyltransferase TrmD [Betaproteobacteria bacterium]